MRRKRPIEIFVNYVEPLILLAMFEFVLVLALTLAENAATDEAPGEPSVGRWGSLTKAVPEFF